MQDGSIPTSRLITIVLWLATLTMGASAWVVILWVSIPTGLMLGLTSSYLAGAAAVSTVRCMIMKAARYVVANMDSSEGRDGGLRTLR